MERCDICGFYSEREQCPYCKGENRSINGRSEDSIVDTFIESKNGRKFSVEKDKAFYNKMMLGIDKAWMGNETGQSLVDLFIRYRRDKGKIGYRCKSIKERLRTLKRKNHVKGYQIETFQLLLDKIESLQKEGRTKNCFKMLNYLEDNIEKMEDAGGSLQYLKRLLKYEKEQDVDIEIPVSRLEKNFVKGDFDTVKHRAEQFVEQIKTRKRNDSDNRNRTRREHIIRVKDEGRNGSSDPQGNGFIQAGEGHDTYKTGELKAQYMIKIKGNGEDIFGQLYRYENETLDNNWHGWTHIAGLEIERTGNQVEFSFPHTYVDDREVYSHLIAIDHDGKKGEAEHLISPDKPSLTVHQTRFDKEILEDEDILELVFISAGGQVVVEGLEFEGEEDF
ncbi:MAG: hypothetical protein ACOC53_00645 [Candidatus Saliniplasma sp.]